MALRKTVTFIYSEDKLCRVAWGPRRADGHQLVTSLEVAEVDKFDATVSGEGAFGSNGD